MRTLSLSLISTGGDRKLKYEIIEFPPCKRTLRFCINDVKITTYVSLPYVQFFLMTDRWGQHSLDTKIYVSATTEPYNIGNKTYRLPLSNQINGKICFGQNAIKLNDLKGCADTFFISWFGSDYGGDMVDFVNNNELCSKKWKAVHIPMIQSINKKQKWSIADPLELHYNEISIVPDLNQNSIWKKIN